MIVVRRGAVSFRAGRRPVAVTGALATIAFAALVAGVALPLALDRVIGPGRTMLGATMAFVVVGAVLITRLHGRVEGWKAALVGLGIFVLYSVIR